MKYLVETALLTHGLKSVTNKEIKNVWANPSKNIAWVSDGKIVIGDIEEYLEFRKKASQLIRINADTLEAAQQGKKSGALTASGTMAVCEQMGIPVAVTGGMGGIGNIKGEELCSDLPALVNRKVILISTGPKDMLDREKTVKWLDGHGVKILGTIRNYITGYVFCGDRVKLHGVIDSETVCKPPLLIIHEIPEEKRIQNKTILAEAVLEGQRAENKGRYYHPAANGKIDELTNGYSSRIQLESLFQNSIIAGKLPKKD